MESNIFTRMNLIIFRVIKEILIAIGLVLIALVFVGVVLRYIFGLSIVWAYELSILLLVWSSMLGAAAGIRLNSHVNLDMFVNLIPDSGRKWIILLKDLIVLAFFVLGTYFGIKVLGRTMRQNLQTINLPVGIIYMSIPFSFIPMILFYLEDIVNRFKRDKHKAQGDI